jgi:DNA-binding winged helix-turn-helix (wHTH) protein
MSMTIAPAARVNDLRGSPSPAGSPSALEAADLRIGGWLVQPSLNLLTRDQESVRLRAQLMDLLLCLASHPGRVFRKEELVAEVWEGRWVAQSALSRCVAELRSALRDDAHSPRVIETITKRGYRLIAPVEVVTVPAVPSPVARAAAMATAGFVEVEREGAARSFWQRLKLSALRAAVGVSGGA